MNTHDEHRYLLHWVELVRIAFAHSALFLTRWECRGASHKTLHRFTHASHREASMLQAYRALGVSLFVALAVSTGCRLGLPVPPLIVQYVLAYSYSPL